VQAPVILIATFGSAPSARRRQVGPGLRRRRRLERLLQAEMVDHDGCARVARRQLSRLRQAAPAQKVHRQPVPRRGGQHAVEAGIGGVLGHAARHHDADGDRPGVFFHSAIVSATPDRPDRRA
jgi:hypothetical protein